MDEMQVLSTRQLSDRIMHLRQRICAAEAQWLAMVAELDGRNGWVAAGCLSMVDWLISKCGMARSTAKERVRVAHELRRRPLIAEQFARGALSYSKVRAITRVTDADEAVDRALLAVAEAGTAADLDVAVAHWEKIRAQDDPAAAAAKLWEKRGMRRYRQLDGLDTVEVVAPPEDVDRLLRVVDAYADRHVNPVEKAPAESRKEHRRVDALLDLVEEGLAHAAAALPVDLERTLVSVGVDYQTLVERAPGGAWLHAGEPLTGEAARRLACDAGIVRVVTKGKSEVLDVGRKTRQWPRAVRRAILFRHGNRCAAPGCGRRVLQIHHVHDWTKGGDTAVHVGVPLCSGHHRLVHELGWTVTYDARTGTTSFVGPHGEEMMSAGLAA